MCDARLRYFCLLSNHDMSMNVWSFLFLDISPNLRNLENWDTHSSKHSIISLFSSRDWGGVVLVIVFFIFNFIFIGFLILFGIWSPIYSLFQHSHKRRDNQIENLRGKKKEGEGEERAETRDECNIFQYHIYRVGAILHHLHLDVNKRCRIINQTFRWCLLHC